MEQTDLLRIAVQTLERLGVSYAIVGSFASGTWGESRFTQDIDIVIDLKSSQVGPLCGAFSEPDFYVSEATAQEAVRQRGQFNVIHPASGNKIDFMIAGETPWAVVQLQRSKRVPLFTDLDANVATPEDVILGKLVYYREGGSEKHLRDISGILMISGDSVDRSYIRQFAATLGVAEIWQAVLERVDRI